MGLFSTLTIMNIAAKWKFKDDTARRSKRQWK